MTEIFSHPPVGETLPPTREAYDEGYATFLAAQDREEVPDEGLPVAVTDEAPPADAPPAPVMLFAGTHAVYDDGAGGVVLVIRDREGNTIQKRLPANLIKMAEKAASGGGLGALGALFGKG